ncbi:hypothetical protein JOF53_000133 [Crossiella equi]|uniref:Uncharacterized protein n=2 Tax=Crossiella equi TaxID=130796 RepID=A0ABS5A3V1_9PSEU|nr:hypothetical protein [Crossiella equi]MBP2471261.1 hypothetical protein [Crossiella equi]
MSSRARAARRLATLLSARAGVPVSVRYDRDLRRYRVVWASGPDQAQMQTLAVTSVASVPDFAVTDLFWTRTPA